MWMFDTFSSSASSCSYSDYGAIEVNTEHVPQRSRVVVTFKMIVSLAMMVGAGYWLFYQPHLPASLVPRLAIIAGVELIYVGFAFFIVPRPNLNDVGYLGGFVNNPIRYSDNYNRSLRSWSIMLAPGRFISSSFLDFATLLGVIKEDPTQEMKYAQEMGLDTAEFAGSSFSSVTCTDIDEPSEKTPAAAPAEASRGLVDRGDFD
ncbi:hypothetical protein [Blastopirellula marina]|uniref:Uncharacterized protein n=1 Tax=Blastopirellula marina DSM 3645 TaxID=314230 RepID=A3ZTR9_9BACT|nr:hypothetical protein [Blastopirellula marina]EAQ79973.1 hypothetical protein DSM3645_05105 [Blastopirellula marina DSM 3645]